MDLYLAVCASIAFTTIPACLLVAIVAMWIADRRGQRRAGCHVVRSERTRPSSRGHRPYRSGRVRL